MPDIVETPFTEALLNWIEGTSFRPEIMDCGAVAIEDLEENCDDDLPF